MDEYYDIANMSNIIDQMLIVESRWWVVGLLYNSVNFCVCLKNFITKYQTKKGNSNTA